MENSGGGTLPETSVASVAPPGRSSRLEEACPGSVGLVVDRTRVRPNCWGQALKLEQLFVTEVGEPRYLAVFLEGRLYPAVRHRLEEQLGFLEELVL